MDNKTNNVNVNEFVERVSEKFGYEDELKDVLKRIIPSMIKGKSDEVNQMLYETFKNVKIFISDYPINDEVIKNAKQEIIGDVNKHVKFFEKDKGEYSKTEAASVYIDEPVFDENMSLIGAKNFICVSRLQKNSQLREIYGTDINLSYLIHELGHAIAARKDEFVQNEDGSITNNIGAIEISSIVDKDKKEVKDVDYSGIFMEETLNTIEEERVLCDVLNIENVKELYSKGYVPSNYQGLIVDIMKSYIEKFGAENFDRFRILKDREAFKNYRKSFRRYSSLGKNNK